MERVTLGKIHSYLSSQSSILANLSKTAAEDILAAVGLIQDCSGAIICVGVGKSAIVGSKFSASLRSLGLRSISMNGSEALHGDLGFIRSTDLIVYISKSGVTDELQILDKFAKSIGCSSIAVFAEGRGSIASKADVLVRATISSELDHLDLIPTNSTLAAMACLDAVSAAIALEKGITESQFSDFHPSGSIGKEASTKVIDHIIPTAQVGSVQGEQTMLEAASLLTEFPTGLLLVKNKNGFLEGVLTDGDLRRATLESQFSVDELVSKYMNTNPLVLSSVDSIRTARIKLKNHKPRPVGVAPVQDGNSVIGVISLHYLS